MPHRLLNRYSLSTAFVVASGLVAYPPVYHYTQGNLTLTYLPPGTPTDATIVFTGTSDRIPLSYQDFTQGFSSRFFVSGHPREMNWPANFPVDDIGKGTFFIDPLSTSTIDNGFFTAQWIKENNVSVAVLRTSDNHGLRSHFETKRLLPNDVTLYFDPTPAYKERSFPDTEDIRLLCRIYETAFNVDFCYAARELWNDPSGFIVRLQSTPSVIADAPASAPG